VNFCNIEALFYLRKYDVSTSNLEDIGFLPSKNGAVSSHDYSCESSQIFETLPLLSAKNFKGYQMHSPVKFYFGTSA